MDKSKKQTQNRMNYLRNRDKVISRSKERWKNRPKNPSNVIPILAAGTGNPELPTRGTRRRAKRSNLEALILCPMVLLMTYYLVSESAKFYQFSEGGHLGAYMKAFIGEGIILVFAALKAPTPKVRWIYRGLLLVAGVYSLWALSARSISESLHQSTIAVQSQKAVAELELELSQRMAARSRYLDLNRLTMAQRYDGSIENVRTQLEAMRRSVTDSGSVVSIVNTLVALILFRALVMAANALCLTRLKRGGHFSPLPNLSRER